MSTSNLSMSSLTKAFATTRTAAAVASPNTPSTSTPTSTNVTSLSLVSNASATSLLALEDDTFPFGKLPPELQLKILKLACQSVRVVAIRPDDSIHFATSDGRPRIWRNYHARATCSTGRRPAILTVNRLFRAEGLKFYKPAFTCRLRRRPIYISFKSDVVYITSPAAWKSFTVSRKIPFPRFIKEVSSEVKHLVIRGNLTEKLKFFLCSIFGGLETLVLKSQGTEADRRTAANLYEQWEDISKTGDPTGQVTFPHLQFMHDYRMQLEFVS